MIGGLTGVMVAMAPFNFQAHDTLLRRRAPAHGADRRRGVSAARRALLLLPARARQAAVRAAGAPLVLAGLRRLQRSPSCRCTSLGLLRHAAPRLHLSGGPRSRTRSTCCPPSARSSSPPAFAVVAWDVLRPEAQPAVCAAQSVECRHARVAAGDSRRSRGACARFREIDRRYPLWEQPNFLRDYDEGRFFLPDAEEGRREMLVTSTIDAAPVQCMRIAGPTFITLIAAIFVGGIFIFPTYKMYSLEGVSAVLALGRDPRSGCGPAPARFPRRTTKDVGLGVHAAALRVRTRPVGWWAMCITMLGDLHRVRLAGVRLLLLLDARRAFLPDAAHGPHAGGPLAAASWWARRGRSPSAPRLERRRPGPRLLRRVGPGGRQRGARRRRLVGTLAGSPLDPVASAYAATVWLLASGASSMSPSASSCSSTASRGGWPAA